MLRFTEDPFIVLGNGATLRVNLFTPTTTISSPLGNPSHHPSDEVIERLAEIIGKDKIYLTSQRGTIEFTTDGERLWVEVGE